MALTLQRDEARRAAQLEESRRIGADIEDPALPVVMSLQQMLADLVFVGSDSSVVHLPTKRVRRREAAPGEYAASIHAYCDAQGNTKETPALPLWRKNPARKTVDVITWAPGRSEFCPPPEGRERAVNTWRGFRQVEPPDDWEARARLFLEHLEYLVPIEAERRRFLQWVAHIVQRPGELPHTCYLMITPARGIGRNWFTGVLARVLRGYTAAGVTLGDVLDGGFNGRLSAKLLATVDETREGMTAKRYERGNALQRIVTEEYRHINEKYGSQRVEFNCCRWIMLSNFPDALPFDNHDRRVIVIRNPDERQTPEYYSRLYRMQNDAAFQASVFKLLETVDLTDFNPGEHAPMNDAKLGALDSMTSDVARAVESFVATWPGRLAGKRDLIKHVREAIGDEPPNRSHLNAVMREMGVETTGREVRIAGTRDYVMILRADLRRSDVLAMDASAIAAEISDARARFAMG